MNGFNIFLFVSSLLSRVRIPYFLTQHGWGHVQRVIENAVSLGSLFRLPPEDMRLLMISAALHDVGNAAHDMGLCSSENEARTKHHEFSALLIRKWGSEGLFEGFLTPKEVQEVAEICFRHRKKTELPTDSRLRRIVILLRVADGMDVDRRRAQMNDMGTYFESLDLPQESIPHWLGHRAILALRIHASGNGLVFEFIVTNRAQAAFQVAELTKELVPLTELITKWSVEVTEVTP